PDDDREGGDQGDLRRRRTPSLGRGAQRRLGAHRAGVRGEHPGDGRRRRADERERLWGRGGGGARGGGPVHRGRSRAAAPGGRREELGLRYRGPSIGDREVVSRASFALLAADAADVKATMADMRRRRKEAQPSGIKTFGSTFVNPDDPRAEGRSAGQLLDAADCRGLARGGARLSPKHANFVENTGDASAADVLEVM